MTLGRRIVLALASGGLLAAAFPPVGVWPAVWAGLVPLAAAVRGVRAWVAFWLGCLAGLVFFLGPSWPLVIPIVRHGHASPWFAGALVGGLAVTFALGIGAFAAVLRRVGEAGYAGLGVIVAWWVVLEWLRGRVLGGAPWLALGYALPSDHGIAQAAELAGVYGVSACIVLGNLGVVIIVRAVPVRRVAASSALIALILASCWTFGCWRQRVVATAPRTHTLRVALVDAAVPQEQKWSAQRWIGIVEAYRRLTLEAAAAGADVVVWPETAIPTPLQNPSRHRRRVLATVREAGVWLVVGSPAPFRKSDGSIATHNRVYAFDPAGEERGVYDKVRLLPFGERVPRALRGVIRPLIARSLPLEPGRTLLALPAGPARLGPLVCFEGMFPDLARDVVRAGADVLVNVTNDAWFAGTSLSELLFVQTALRAVEQRRPLLRIANSGVSAVVDATGAVRWRHASPRPSWHVERIAWAE